MSEEVQYLISSSIRLAIFCVGNMICMEIGMVNLLNRRRSLLAFRIYWILGKVLIHNVLLFYIIRYYFGNEKWYGIMFSCFITVMAIIAYLIFCYTFEGGLLKIAIAGMGVECIEGFIGYFCLGIVNYLEKRSSLFCLVDTFQWMDLLIPVLHCGGIWLAVNYLKPVLARYKDLQLRHRKILWIFFVSYVGTATFTVFTDNQVAIEVFVYILLVSVLCAAVILLAVWRYHTGIRAEQDLLEIQLNAMKFHYTAVQEQIRQMENSRCVIETQMKEIVQLEQSPSADQKIAEYLKELKTEYKEIQAGVYCDNWMVDAVLCYYGEKLHKEGISFDCSMQGYLCGNREERDLIQLYLILLNWGLQANRNIQESDKKQVYLHTSTVKNQLIIIFFSNCTEKDRIPLKILRRHIKKYGGITEVQREKDGVRITLAL